VGPTVTSAAPSAKLCPPLAQTSIYATVYKFVYHYH